LRVSIFFLDPGKGISRLQRIETGNRPTTGPVVSGIIVTCCSKLAINRSLVYITAATARIPDAQPRNTEQWHIQVVGDSGGRRFCQRALITLVTPLHRPGSANAAASVCHYRKQKRSPFTATLEQTPKVLSRVANFHTYTGSLHMSITLAWPLTRFNNRWFEATEKQSKALKAVIVL